MRIYKFSNYLIVLASSALVAGQAASAADEPNILVIMADDVGWSGLSSFHDVQLH